MKLTPEDLQSLRQLAATVSDDRPEYIVVLRRLRQAYETYATPKIVTEWQAKHPHAARSEFFTDTYKTVLANYGDAGKSFEEAFMHATGERLLRGFLTRFGVTPYHMDDVIQELHMKFAKGRMAEKYNPFVTTWRAYVRVSVQRFVLSFNKSKQVRREPTYQGTYGNGEPKAFDPISMEPEIPPEAVLAMDSFIDEFERRLLRQPHYEAVELDRYKFVCTILPPGIPELPVRTPKIAYFIRAGKNSGHRIEPVHLPPGWHRGYAVLYPQDLVTDVREVSDNLRLPQVVRSPMVLYLMLRAGYSTTEVAAYFRAGRSTLNLWVSNLSSLFRKCWRESPEIPAELRGLGYAYCPACGRAFEEVPDKTTKLGKHVVFTVDGPRTVTIEGKSLELGDLLSTHIPGGLLHQELGKAHWVATEDGDPYSAPWCCCGKAVVVKSPLDCYPWSRSRNTAKEPERAKIPVCVV